MLLEYTKDNSLGQDVWDLQILPFNRCGGSDHFLVLYELRF